MKKERHYYVYIATNKANKVLYAGVTNNILNRDNQHKEKICKKSFTAKHNVNKVVYYETFTDVYAAIAREKEIKGWRREKKIKLIVNLNPGWKDLLMSF